jgi:hypothetical protein
MQPSSIGLAAAFALTLAMPGPANAGFVARAPHIIRPVHMIAPAHMIMSNHERQFGRFGARGEEAFRHGRVRQFPLFGSGYIDGPAFSPAADTEAPSFVAGAPVVNVTIVTQAPGAASSPPGNYVASTRPKIILIGAHPRTTRFEKLPIVIYGRS